MHGKREGAVMLKYLYTETRIRIGLIALPIVMGASMLYREYKTGVFYMPKEVWIPKLIDVLNGIMGAFTGVFLGHGILEVWRYHSRPELYAMQSAPWYTSILVYGAFTVVVLAVCIVIKIVLKYYARKSGDKAAK